MKIYATDIKNNNFRIKLQPGDEEKFITLLQESDIPFELSLQVNRIKAREVICDPDFSLETDIDFADDEFDLRIKWAVLTAMADFDDTILYIKIAGLENLI